MSESKQKAASTSSPVAAVVFYIISFLLLPVMVIGYVIWVVMAFAGRKSGISWTAQGPLSARWFQHKLGTRRDEPSNRLMTALPGVSPLALYFVFGPMLLAHRVSGYVPGTFRYPFEGDITLQNQASAWQTFYDSVVDRHLKNITQFVILGAGFDTRAFRLPEDLRVQSFEVDTQKTLGIKRDMLEKTGIDSNGVTFVATDFEKEDWLNRLVEAGFDAEQPALFLWEGVTPYLDREAVADTLCKIARTARGSVVAFDYFTTEILKSQALYLRTVRASLSAGGEPLKFGIDSTPPLSARLAEFLQSCGLTLVEQHTLGQETRGKHAWGGYALAIVK